MKVRRIKIGDFIFTELEDGLYIVFHPLWSWIECFKNGKRTIRLQAK